MQKKIQRLTVENHWFMSAVSFAAGSLMLYALV